MQSSENVLEPNGKTPDSTMPAPPQGEALPTDAFSRPLDRLVHWLMWISGGLLFVYVIFMFVDVFLRYIFGKPIPYDVDITQMILIILCFFSLAYTQQQKSHIFVDLFTARLKPRPQQALASAMYIICTVVCGLITWQSVLNTMQYIKTNPITYGGLELWQVSILMPLGAAVLTLVFLRDTVYKYIQCRKEGLGPLGFTLSILLPLAFLALCLVWMYDVWVPMSSFTFGMIGIGILFVLIFIGMPVAFGLVLVSILVMGYASGAKIGYMSVGPTLFTHVSTYTWIVIPLYIMMSYFILVGELGTAAFVGAYKWVGHLRGGLAVSVVAGSTLLAAVVGEGTAATVTMGLVAYPEMRRYKYDDGLSTGCIAAGATLGPIIPPSVPFIVYGIITETSIGDLFMAGVVPGIMLAFAFIIWIFIYSRIRPNAAPAGPKIPWGERFRSIPIFGPIVLLFLIVIGGIYAGIFTVMEGGGIGAFMSLVIALANRKLNWAKFKEATRQSMKFIGMIFLMVTGSMMLANSLGACGASRHLTEAVVSSGVSPVMLIIILMIIYTLFGLVADAPVIILLTVPILWSMLEGMGIDLVWFGVLGALVGGMGGITPPYAMGIFMLRAIACPDVSLGVMYKGIIPFVICTIVVVALLIAFPDLCTWLPYSMK